MGCLPSSAFFYVIELDASTTVRVAKMIERIYHPSSSSCLARIPWTLHKESDSPMRSLLLLWNLSSPTLEKDMYSFAHEWVLQTPFVETSGRDQHLSLLDCSPPQYPDTQSPSQPTFVEIHMLSQQDYHTELQIYQMILIWHQEII